MRIPTERRLAFSALFPPCVPRPSGTAVWPGKHMSRGPCMCFLIKCKMGPGPLRQGPRLQQAKPPPSTSLPPQRSPRRLFVSNREGNGTQQIGGNYDISCCRARGADALSPNRFSCYQLRGGGRGGGSAGALPMSPRSPEEPQEPEEPREPEEP